MNTAPPHLVRVGRLARVLQVVVLLAVEAALVAALVAVGRRPSSRIPLHHLGDWLDHSPPADVLVALLRWVALVGAGWLLASTVLYALAAASHVPGALRTLRWSTLPAVRRAVDAALAVTVVSGAVLAPTAARAAAMPSTTTTSTTSTTTASTTTASTPAVRDGRAVPLAGLPAATAPTAAPPPPAAGAPSPFVTPPPPPAVTTTPLAPIEVVVVPGDSLWELAAAHLAAGTGRTRGDVGDAEIAPYWLRVCDDNRTRLASGDPNLIRPGETVVLPPVG